MARAAPCPAPALASPPGSWGQGRDGGGPAQRGALGGSEGCFGVRMGMLWGKDVFSSRTKLGDVNKLVTYGDKHITSPPPSSLQAPGHGWEQFPAALCLQPPAHNVSKPNHFILFYFVFKNHCNKTGIGTKRGLCSAFVNFSADACKRRQRVNIDFPLKQARGFIDCRGEGAPAAAWG